MKEFKIYSKKYGEKIVFVDDEDMDRISKLTWSIAFVRGNWYAVHTFWSNGKAKQIKMHRYILNESNPIVAIDHKDRNGLNNTKENLRRSTIQENSRNVGANKTSTTGFKGVSLYTKHYKAGFYAVRLKFNGKNHFGGYFKDAIEAAKKYNEMAIKYHGEFAYLNEIPI